MFDKYFFLSEDLIRPPVNGISTIKFDKKDIFNRVKYHGQLKNGLPWGNGSMTWKNGESYTGSWISGIKQGYGNYF